MAYLVPWMFNESRWKCEETGNLVVCVNSVLDQYSQLPLISTHPVLAKSGDIYELWNFRVHDVILSSTALSPISYLGFISHIISSHLTLLTKLNPSKVLDQTSNLLNMMLIAFSLFPAYSWIPSRWFSASKWKWNSGGGPNIYFSSA